MKSLAAAVIQIEDGDPGAAYHQISRFTDKDPAAYMERSRAALQAGDVSSAVKDLNHMLNISNWALSQYTHGALLR